MSAKYSITPILTAYSNYESECEKLTKGLRAKAEFDFWVAYVPGDGVCLCADIEGGSVAPINACIQKIRIAGKLTVEDYRELCI